MIMLKKTLYSLARIACRFRFKSIVILLITLASSSIAQTTIYTRGRESVKSDVNFTEAASYEATHPVPKYRRMPLDEEEDEYDRPEPTEPDPSEVHMIQRSAARLNNINTTPGYLSVAQAPADTFESTKSNGTDIPPDTHGDVDITYCVTAINPNIHIQRRDGTNSSLLSLSGFWSTGISGPSVLPSGTDPFDPRVHYDPYYNRWIMITDAVNQTGMTTSTILIAVSATCDPKGTWHRYAIRVDPTDAAWLDYPCVGFNSKWITVTGNMFKNTSGGATGGVVYVFDYASIMAGTGAPYVKISQSSSFTLCPAITYDTTQESAFLMEVNSGNSGKLRLWKISGPVSSPVMSSVGYPTSTMHWKGSGPGNGADFAPQLGTSDKTDAGDNRIHRLIYRNNSLWCAHTVFLPTSGAVTRCSVMWWQVDTTATPIQNGLIDDPVTPSFFDYPSIAVNANNDALIGFSYHSSLMYPSAAYVYRMHTDPLDSMHQPFIFRHGQANYFQNFGGGKNRWGDYSATTTDPRNDLDFYTIQESTPASPANYWDTWWAHIVLYPGVPHLIANYDTISAGSVDSVKFTAPVKTQCNGTIRWDFAGGSSTSGVGTGPQDVKWTTTGLKVVAYKDSILGSVITYYDTIYVHTPNSVSTLNHNNENIQVVPNPNSGVFDIVFSQPVSERITINLMNMQGRVVYSNQFAVRNNTVSIETNGLPPGVYVATMNIDGQIITQKVTITK